MLSPISAQRAHQVAHTSDQCSSHHLLFRTCAYLQIIHKLFDLQFGFMHPCHILEADSLPWLAIHNRETSHSKLILGRKNKGQRAVHSQSWRMSASVLAPPLSPHHPISGGSHGTLLPPPRRTSPHPLHSCRQMAVKVIFQTYKGKCLFYIINCKKAL